MKRVLASALSIVLLSGFSCEGGMIVQKISDFETLLTFVFDGVDDDETPECIEAEEEIDLTSYQELLAQAGEWSELNVVGVTMTMKNIRDTNTAQSIHGTCNLFLGDGADVIDLGSYTFEVSDGTTVQQAFNVDAVSSWLTERIREHGKVKFSLTACMGADEQAGFDIDVLVKGEVIGHTPAM